MIFVFAQFIFRLASMLTASTFESNFSNSFIVSAKNVVLSDFVWNSNFFLLPNNMLTSPFYQNFSQDPFTIYVKEYWAKYAAMSNSFDSFEAAGSV